MPALAFRPEPALMRPEYFPAFVAVLQVERCRRLDHSPGLARLERFGNIQICANVRFRPIADVRKRAGLFLGRKL